MWMEQERIRTNARQHQGEIDAAKKRLQDVQAECSHPDMVHERHPGAGGFRFCPDCLFHDTGPG